MILKEQKYQKKILFEDYKELCTHINKNYNNIENWWNSKKVQNAINEFVNIHAFNNNNKINKIAMFIKELL